MVSHGNNLTIERREYPAGMMQVERRDKYQQMCMLLNEKQWRQYLALEAKERGSVSLVAQEAGVSANIVRRGVREVEVGEGYTPGDRQRKKGGGRKRERVRGSRCSFRIQRPPKA